VHEDGCHVFPVRVYYEDTDAAGIVYYANYLKFAERARTEMLRAAGFDHHRLLQEHGMAFAVKRFAADYVAPARLDDALEVHTRVVNLRGASIDAQQDIKRDGRDLARCAVTILCLGPDGRPVRLPAELRDRMRTFLNDR